METLTFGFPLGIYSFGHEEAPRSFVRYWPQLLSIPSVHCG